MNIFENDYDIIENTVVTLGKFDGLHEGHRELIRRTVEEARRREYKSLLYTFNQNPITVLQGEEIRQLLSKQEKIIELKKMKLDYIVFQDFTYEFSQMLPEQFAKSILKDKLKAKLVIVGFNYRFGKNAEGDAKLLEEIGEKYGFEVKIVEPIERNGTIISSSYIRDKELI